MPKMDWEKAAKAKYDAINDLIPKEWRLSEPVPSIEDQPDVTGDIFKQHLSEREIDITETDAVDIVEKTSKGVWTAVEVTKAFCHRASLAHQYTNCLHEIFFDAAFADAEELDQVFKAQKVPVGPLHGLPISLKDQFHVKGVETTMGYVGWINTFEGKAKPNEKNDFESELVKDLRALGGILFVKTSVPHSLMCGETLNNIIKCTPNPKNRRLAVGGSSGGEGALILLHGSPLGFGTDIGGSVRIPAAFNDLYGLRPSSGRLPYEGVANSMDGQGTVLSVIGPISHSAASLRLGIKSVVDRKPWLHDPLCLEIPWRHDQELEILEAVKSKSLSFGILKHDGMITPHPPVQRALNVVTAKLQQLGFRTIDWKPPAHSRGLDIILEAWLADGGLDIHGALSLSGEPIVPQVARFYGNEATEQADATKINANNVAKRKYQKEYLEYWNDSATLSGTGRPVDAIIAPCAPFSVARPGRFKHYGYTSIFNALDYTCCAVPITTADKEIDVIDKEFKPVSDLDTETAEDYDPDLYHETPVALQVVGRRLQEEKILAIAEYIGQSIASHKAT